MLMNDDSFYMRNPKMIVLSSSQHVVFVGEDGSLARLDTDRPRDWSQLMQELANPLSGSAVRELSTPVTPVDAVWQRLIGEGHVLEAQDEVTLVSVRDRMFVENQSFDLIPGPPRFEHLVIACTGSVVAGLIAPTVLSLLYSGFQSQLDVILTESALKFVTRDLFESYGVRTWVDAFERQDDIYVPHVQLGRTADCILVMPATANSLHRIADATCTDLLSMTIAASDAPVVIAPAMNETMWNHPGVQRNLQQLRDDGMTILEPTLIFGAADVASQRSAMFGGHGTLWGGPRSLKHALRAVAEAGSP